MPAMAPEGLFLASSATFREKKTQDLHKPLAL